MTKKKSAPKPGRPPKHGSPDEKGRSGKRLSIDIDPEIRALIDVYIAYFQAEHSIELGITQVVEKALRELFTRSGHWPPKSPAN